MTRLGVAVANTGERAVRPGVVAMATTAEEAGADSLHISDHVLLVEGATSRYPYAEDGRFPWPPDLDVFDPLVACAWIAAHTRRVEVGPSVLVLPQRHPFEVAKTAATIDRLSGERLFLGVGAGWLAEEFAALGRDFPSRVARMHEAVEVLRRAWSGDRRAYEGEHFRYGPGVHCRPLPARPGGVPLLFGGMSKAALKRAATMGDGWIALATPSQSPRGPGESLRRAEELLHTAGRGRDRFRAVLRITATTPQDLPDLPERVVEYAALGFDEIVVDPLWRDLDEAAGVVGACRRALG
ncbi:TIGR03619 family F420-dependent LLM class oxidoreductase [Embleya hyalina]|uniref:LLM class F420-dependent oxidoreductase n=1 Tax=Embleya hyalina TaxID=516124 RepID=A0A401YQX1_9ACTN|nr:TIGR03619 family F420-dependent LLM class oxidoreductase [Embleya hyalina]GCD96991.1 LLM class F420-dependent oxidoreductase [Embleya hyalina]